LRLMVLLGFEAAQKTIAAVLRSVAVAHFIFISNWFQLVKHFI
jgi:hypothetical protein